MDRMSSLNQFQNVVDTLTAGFESLLKRVEDQQKIEQELRLHLAEITQKYNSDTSYDTSANQIDDWRHEIVKQLEVEQQPDPQPAPSLLGDTSVAKAWDLVQHMKRKMSPSGNVRKCPVAHKVVDQEDLERDFTTPGVPGQLGCPFALKVTDELNNNISIEDPIAAEFHQEVASGRSGGSARASNKCPIRFLDKHSPEEVAQYFENHKHEIPRSHEICVRRYQSNENQVRQLDAKYGNLVSMIQGLGNKHKAYLPEDEKTTEAGRQEDSDKAVEKWARTVDQRASPDVEVTPDERVPHFEKPMREIRVGESPSRPWGISLPAAQPHVSTATPTGCPVKHEKPKTVSEAAVVEDTKATPQPGQASPSTASKKESIGPSRTPIVFNGPVFIGYPADQAAMFLRNLGVGGTPTEQ